MEDRSNLEIALVALYALGGAQHWVHIEDVALKCYELAPKKFSWRKYPNYPDIQPARFALEDAARPANGALVSGSSKDMGWMLTLAGIRTVKQLHQKEKGGEVRNRSTRAARQEVERFLNALENHQAYQKYVTNKKAPEVELHELADLLRCPLDSGAAIFKQRLETLMTRSYDAGHDELVEFFSWCKQQFHDFLSGSAQK